MKKSEKKKQQFDNFIRYSNMGFQMFAVIALAVFAGFKIDQNLANRIPVFTVIFSILGVGGAIYHAIKDFIN
jgi:F0F1-type ATP synthase assembly protein I